VVRTQFPPLNDRSESLDDRPPESVSAHETVAQHIARVAADLFARQGFDATAVREIVEAAEVTKPTLYYHFGSKMGLAEALLTRPLEELCSTLGETVRDEPDPLRVVVRLIEAHFRFCRESPNRARLAYAVMFGPSNSSLAGMLMPYGERFDRLWDDAVNRLIAAGVCEGDPATREGLAAALRGLVVIHTVDYLYRDHPLPDDLPARLVGQLLQGFVGRTSPPSPRSGARHV
jgi:TetR/AcrR family transcriptional regulator